MNITTDLFIPARFSGPPGSGNGGWTGGALAALLSGPTPPSTVSVRLLRPPPLEAPISVAAEQGLLVAVSESGERIAQAKDESDDAPEAVEPVDLATARGATEGFPGHTAHPFPDCFVCGTDRAEGDGLRIFPGPVQDTADGRARVAAPWTPAPEYADPAYPEAANLPATWAALDCIGGWAGDLTERMMVLGSMTAHVLARPRIGVEHVLVGESRHEDGRKVHTGVSLYDPEGAADGSPVLVASATHIWITVDPATFGASR